MKKQTMKSYRISGTNRRTGEFTTANVQGEDYLQAMALMGMTHHRLVCLDKRGVEL